MRKTLGGNFPPIITYTLNGHVRDLLYFLVDGIYPDLAIFAKNNRRVDCSPRSKKTASRNRRLFGRM